MNRPILTILIVLLCLTGTAWGAAPRLEVENGNHQFGQLFQGEKLEHVFVIKNTGDAPLVIEKVRTSCGCTAALPSSEELAPGETGELQVTFDSKRFRGKVVKTVYLYTNDPVQQVSQLYLRGTVKEELDLTPRRIDLTDLPAGKPFTAGVTVKNQGEQTVNLELISSTSPEITGEANRTRLPPGETTELTVTVTPPEGKPRLNGYLFVNTDSSNTPQLRIPVNATVSAGH